MRPFLRWAGGKAWLVERLVPEILAASPQRYVEPFLGGGAILLGVVSLRRMPVIVSDASKSLINLWKQIHEHPGNLAITVERLYRERGNSKDGYYAIRALFNAMPPIGLTAAARMLYLNALCFNGLWRENSKGAMNTPFGDVRSPNIPTREELEAISHALNGGASISDCDFRDTLARVKAGDAVYIDPPYHGGYVSYTQDGFSEDDQRDLAEALQAAANRGARIWASNSNTPLVQELYAWANVEPIHEARNIAARAENRKAAPCVLIRSK